MMMMKETTVCHTIIINGWYKSFFFTLDFSLKEIMASFYVIYFFYYYFKTLL